MSILKNIFEASIAAALMASGAAHAGIAGGTVNNAMSAVVEGNFNARGYSVIDIKVADNATVDFLFTGGYRDATFSLFNGAGEHLVSNDDSNGLYPHLTQDLVAGNYSFMVSYCCTVFDGLGNYTYRSSDGFNNGTYAFGGGASLASVTAYLDNNAQWAPANATYHFTMTNADLGQGNVPEPQTVALFGAALAGMAMARHHKSKT